VAGGREFDQGRFDELVVYIATRLGPEAALGRVKLAKLLMHSDFMAYRLLGRSITGATYQKWEHGHLPSELIITEKDLQAQEAIQIVPEDYYGKTLKRITARRDPRMGDFSEEEIEIIESAIHTYGYESATYLSQLAHEEIGWRLAQYKEEIPYRTVYLAKTGPTAGDIRRGEELASLYGWN
jgi:Protein of unknown function (DUF4065)